MSRFFLQLFTQDCDSKLIAFKDYSDGFKMVFSQKDSRYSEELILIPCMKW